MQGRREIQREQSRGSSMRTIRNLLIAILLILLIVWSVFVVSNQPRNSARRQTISLAEKHAHLQSPDQFYIYNQENTYYTISGKDQQNQPILVTVPQHGDKVRVLKRSSGITAARARAMTKSNRDPREILKVALGIFNDKTVWEVTYRNQKGNLCYDLINFKTGRYVQNVNNL